MTTAKVRVRGVFWRDSRKGTQTNAQTRARGDWYIRYTDQHGKLRKERVGPRNLAIELYRKRKTEVREGRFFPEMAKKPVVLFDEIAEDFLAYSREHKKSAEHGCAPRCQTTISDPISLDSLVTNAMMASKEVSDGWEGDQADGDGRAGGGISDGERASRALERPAEDGARPAARASPRGQRENNRPGYCPSSSRGDDWGRRNYRRKMVDREGIEPPTPGFSVPCSTN